MGHMIEAGARCAAHCSTCLVRKEVDLNVVAAAKGESFSLWGRRVRCRVTPGCKGSARFYLHVQGHFRPMWDF